MPPGLIPAGKSGSSPAAARVEDGRFPGSAGIGRDPLAFLGVRDQSLERNSRWKYALGVFRGVPPSRADRIPRGGSGIRERKPERQQSVCDPWIAPGKAGILRNLPPPRVWDAPAPLRLPQIPLSWEYRRLPEERSRRWAGLSLIPILAPLDPRDPPRLLRAIPGAAGAGSGNRRVLGRPRGTGGSTWIPRGGSGIAPGGSGITRGGSGIIPAGGSGIPTPP